MYKSIKIKKIEPLTNKPIIKKTIPLILLNLYKKNVVGNIKIMTVIITTIISKFRKVQAINKVAIIEKKPQIIEITKKFKTNFFSVKGPFPSINLGRVNAASF